MSKSNKDRDEKGKDSKDERSHDNEKDSKSKSDFCLPVHLIDEPEYESEGCENPSHVHSL